jgi:hypothetical protein
MKLEIKSHEALSLLFHRYGLPNVTVMDGSKEQTEGEFKRKLCDEGCHTKPTVPHAQSSSMGEGAVRDLNRGIGRKMMQYT